MARLVSTSWVSERLGQEGFAVIDPRRPMKYLSGHLPRAINLPAYKAFDADGSLLPPDQLARWIGGIGLGDKTVPIIYDSPEGQNAAMIAWILEYLGRDDVHLMRAFFEQWKIEGREVLYRPIEAKTATFNWHENSATRATLTEVQNTNGAQLADFRSREEFTGERDLDNHPGHIPGAINLVWRGLANPPTDLLKPSDELARLVESAGLTRDQPVIAYCRSGPRAALGYLALKHLGYQVRLFDGSWARWARAQLPASTD
ncbi:MAG TPA: rhodanese-like domain-containing protein [Candidatus Binataceae bacterium]|jgi:thiosulfate/3-mercaptopyruvate sulfurtransferase|nr:rhodanese-like domain-containing protein [Candidatus Binataceae bacterium]